MRTAARRRWHSSQDADTLLLTPCCPPPLSSLPLTLPSPPLTWVKSCCTSSCSRGGRLTMASPLLNLLLLVRRNSTGDKMAWRSLYLSGRWGRRGVGHC